MISFFNLFYAQANIGGESKAKGNVIESERDIPLRGKEDSPSEGIMRSVKELPAQVCFTDGQLTIDFSYPVSCVTVSITNVSTGKVVYWNVYDLPGQVTIDLTGEASGKYQVELISESWSLCGDFSIE